MPDRDELIRDASAALSDVDRLKRDINISGVYQIEELGREAQLPMVNDLVEFRERINDLMSRLQDLLSQVADLKGSSGASGAAFSMASLVSEMKQEFEWLRSLLEDLEHTLALQASTLPHPDATRFIALARSALHYVTTHLVPTMKRLLAKVWQIISGLLTPKEWKLSGEAGTGVLGLAKVAIEITFGP